MNAPRTHICNSIEVHLYLTKQMTTKQARLLHNHQQLFTLPRPTSSPQLINLNRNEYFHKKLFTIWTEARYLSIYTTALCTKHRRNHFFFRWRKICISHQWWLNAWRPNINTLLQYGTQIECTPFKLEWRFHFGWHWSESRFAARYTALVWSKQLKAATFWWNTEPNWTAPQNQSKKKGRSRVKTRVWGRKPGEGTGFYMDVFGERMTYVWMTSRDWNCSLGVRQEEVCALGNIDVVMRNHATNQQATQFLALKRQKTQK